jgi:hypothetical protein
LKYLVILLTFFGCESSHKVAQTTIKPKGISPAKSVSLKNSGGAMTVSPGLSTITSKKGVIRLSYESVASLYDKASKIKGECERQNSYANILQGGRVSINIAYVKNLHKMTGRFSIKVKMNGEQVSHAEIGHTKKRWNSSHPLLKKFEQISFHLDISKEVQGNLLVTIIDKVTHEVTVFTLASNEAFMAKNDSVVSLLRKVNGCTPESLQKKVLYKGKSITISPVKIFKNGLFAGITGYKGAFQSLTLLDSYIDNVSSANSVHTIPSEPPPWHVFDLAFTKGLLKRCKVNVNNVMGKNIFLVPTKSKDGPLDTASLVIRKIVAFPIDISIRCAGLEGDFTVVSTEKPGVIQGLVQKNKIKVDFELKKINMNSRKINGNKMELSIVLNSLILLREQHIVLTRIILQLLILDTYLKREQGVTIEDKTIRSEFWKISALNSRFSRTLRMIGWSSYRRNRYVRKPVFSQYMKKYENSTHPPMMARYLSYKKYYDIRYEKWRVFKELSDMIKKLRKTHSFYHSYKNYKEPLLFQKKSTKEKSTNI